MSLTPSPVAMTVDGTVMDDSPWVFRVDNDGVDRDAPEVVSGSRGDAPGDDLPGDDMLGDDMLGDDIVVGRRRGGIRLFLGLVFAVVLLSTAAVMGGVRPWGSGGDSPLEVVRALLSDGGTTAAQPGDALALRELWALQGGTDDALPVIPVLTDADPLLAVGLDQATSLVSGVEGGPVVWVGEVPVFEVVVVDRGDGFVVDLEASFLRARSRTLGLDGQPSELWHASTPEEAASRFLSALLAGDGSGLAAVSAADAGAPVLRYPGTFGWLTSPFRTFALSVVELSPPVAEPDGSHRVGVSRVVGTSLAGDPAELELFGGCVTVSNIDPLTEVAQGADGADCLQQGTSMLGRPIPLEVVVQQGANGWRVDHARTDLAAWSATVGADGISSGWLTELLVRWGIAIPEEPGSLIPLRDGVEPEPASGPMPAPAPAPEEVESPPSDSPSDPPTGAGPGALLPSRPAGVVELTEWSGVFTADRLAQMGMVGSPADLADYGFVTGAAIAWVSGDGGALVLILRYDSPNAALAEFDVFHGRSVVPGLPSTAAYGPGDFGGPTDQGAITQYRVVRVSGTDHVIVETWGDSTEVIGQADTLLALLP